MNDQPNPSEFKIKSNFGAQPSSPSGLRRLSPWLLMGATGGTVIALVMYGTQIAFPDRFKPSVVAGTAAGDTVRAEIEAMRDAKIDMERRIADATAQANAKAQADLMVMQKTMEARTASLEPVAQMAGAADVFCMLGNVAAAFTAPSGNINGDWRRPDPGSDFNHGAKAVASATCGVSTGLRQGVMDSQLEAVSTAAAARGMSMMNGAVQQAYAPAMPATPSGPTTTATSGVPHMQLTSDQKAGLRDYSIGLPHEAHVLFTSGLDMSVGRPDEWYDRVAMYRVTHPY